MNTARMAILGVASLAGVCAVGVLAHGLAGAKAPPPAVAAAPVAPPTPTVRVLVALHDINVGERIQPADMGWQTWPADAVNPTYVTDGTGSRVAPQGQLGKVAAAAASDVQAAMTNPAAGAGATFVGAIVREKITAHEPLIAAKVVRAGQSGVMAVTLEPGMRAVALPLSAESAAGGFILPGDHVDVLMTRSADSGTGTGGASTGKGFITTTVMRNVRVLAVDQNMGGGKTAAAIGATATVEASPAQAEYLVLAKSSGTLTLTLRSFADAAGGAEVGGMHHDAGAMPVRVFRNSASSTAAMVNQ